MKLHRMTLKCFRGFPVEETLVFHGKNVLLYGENGSGKSTLFHALREALPRTKNRRPIGTLANTFIEPPITPPPNPPPASAAKVELEFRRVGALDDPTQARIVTWNHTTPAACTEWEFQVARRIMALDYRSVLETHYVQRTAVELNIYPLLARTILGSAQNPTVTGNAAPTFREQWQDMLDSAKKRPTRRTYDRRKLGHVYNVITSIQTGLKSLEPKIVPLANEYLARLCTGLKVGIDVKEGPWYEVKPHEKRLTSEGKALVSAELFGMPVSQPAPFFNEARLSAMALALYLAGVRLSVPDKDQEMEPFPRVLVLDDVLIGLDLSHRLPLLELVAEKFPDWQVLLFTHDRAWFELAQVAIVGAEPWLSIEMRARPFQHGTQVFESPNIKPNIENLADHYLDAATRASAAGEDRTAALHARAALEVKLKGFCAKRRVQVAYDLDGRHLNTDHFIDAIERRLCWSGELPKALFAIQRVKLFRHGVLNPLAHFHPVTIHPGEVERAIAAVKTLSFPENKTDFAAETAKALTKAIPTNEEKIAAACWMRTAFETDLRGLLLRLNAVVKYRDDWRDLPLHDLWAAGKGAMAAKNAAMATALSAGLEAHPKLFVDPWRFDLVAPLTKPELDVAWAALLDPASLPNAPKTRLATFA